MVFTLTLSSCERNVVPGAQWSTITATFVEKHTYKFLGQIKSVERHALKKSRTQHFIRDSVKQSSEMNAAVTCEQSSYPIHWLTTCADLSRELGLYLIE